MKEPLLTDAPISESHDSNSTSGRPTSLRSMLPSNSSSEPHTKAECINQQSQETEQRLTIDSKFMHAKIQDISGKKIKCSSTGCIKSKDRTMLMEKKEIFNRWSEYVEDLFKDDRSKKPKIKKNIEGPTIFKEEVEAALKKMKNGKGIRPDYTPVEIIKALDNIGIDSDKKTS
ncbi:hypothetical protein PoB_006776100 [Plakobranchus ocellatus]|uniref:Uncharacterized protein n=1 Tax=Plakobranchus ocellatus TaxID=259542 RepID=A0AAV4DB09_9GAST|nr:hypothetical protein PoB_006776100 [Plakobranchus ocellatus]